MDSKLPPLDEPTPEEITHVAVALNVKCGLSESFEPKGIAEKFRFYAVLARCREEQRERQLEDALTRLEKAKEMLQNMVDITSCNWSTQYNLCSTCELSVFNAKAFLEAERKGMDFKLPPEQWKAFLEALDRPAEANPVLHRLLNEPSAIELAIRAAMEAER